MPEEVTNYDFEAEFRAMNRSIQLRKPSNFEDGLYCVIEGRNAGTPFALEPRFAFRKSEVTLWAGQNGAGKSLLTGQIALQLANEGSKVAVMSLEMMPRYTLSRMLRQSVGHKPVPDEIPEFFRKYDELLLILDHQGSISPSVLFGAILVAARDFDCDHIIVDNLMKVVAGDDDYNSQKEVVQTLCDIAHQTSTHIHLIHHVRKSGREDDEIDKFSIKGSSSITDQVDNVVLLQRNLKKERAAQSPGSIPNDSEADSVLRVVKQRNGDWEGIIRLWFNRNATAFCLTPKRVPCMGSENWGAPTFRKV